MQKILGSCAGPGLRERKKIATREALIDAAHTLVGTSSYEHVTVEGIASLAGVSTRTFFNYFDSKDDAVLGFPRWDADDDAAETFAAGGPTGDDASDLSTLATRIITAASPDRKRFVTGMELARRHPHLLARQFALAEEHKGRLRELFVRRAAGAGSTLDADFGPLAVIGLIHGALLAWTAAGATSDPAQFVPEARERLRTLLTVT